MIRLSAVLAFGSCGLAEVTPAAGSAVATRAVTGARDASQLRIAKRHGDTWSPIYGLGSPDDENLVLLAGIAPTSPPTLFVLSPLGPALALDPAGEEHLYAGVTGGGVLVCPLPPFAHTMRARFVERPLPLPAGEAGALERGEWAC